MQAFDIVGYTFNADEYDPEHMVEVLIAAGRLSPGARGMTTKAALDQLAEYDQLNRYDEHSFDSGDFPKVIFADSVTDDDVCGVCGEPLIEG